MTSLGAGFRYPPQWSPDSKKIAFIDQAMRIRIYDDSNRTVPRSIRAPIGSPHPALEASRCSGRPIRDG